MKQKPIQAVPEEERTLAGLAYLLGLVPALIILMLKKSDSLSLQYHAIQAALYDGFVRLTAIMLLMVSLNTLPVLMVAAWLGTNILADFLAPEGPLVYMILTIMLMLFASCVIGVAAVLILCLNLIDLVAAACLFAGRNWHYPIIGKWAERLIQRNPERP
ncbi:MAG: hypothetical protein ACOCYU_06925 [Brevefilum sp.]